MALFSEEEEQLDDEHGLSPNSNRQHSDRNPPLASSNGSDSSRHLFTPVILSILGTETAERYAYFGFRAVLVLFFVNDLYLDDNTAISMFAYTTCLANFSPLLGAILAESKLGRFKTILWFGCLYAVGLMILTYAAFLDFDESDPYRAHGVEDSLRSLFWKRALTCLGLILVCTGTGGIKPCVNIFGADQVALRDRGSTNTNANANAAAARMKEHEEEEIIGRTATTQTDMERFVEEEDHAVREFFNFFYFCINVGAVSSFATIPIVKHHFGFGVAFLLPTLFMGLALTLFYSKRKEYIYRKTENDGSSSLATTFRICFQLIGQKLSRNRHQQQPLAQNDPDVDDNSEQRQELVEQTEEFQDEPLPSSFPQQQQQSAPVTKAPNMSWAEHQMALEDAHQALQILPIMAMLPIFWMLYDQQGSVWTLQASRMALHGLEPEQLSILNPLEIMIFIPLFDRIIYPAMEARQWNIAPLRRMGWGMVLAAVSFVVSGFLEHIIENSKTESVDVFWMIPQITILAVGEIFLSVTGLEYAYSRSPDRLKGFIMATYLLMIAFGDLMGGILYSSVFRHVDRAVVMYVCAALMLLNRIVFGRVVVATQQDTGATVVQSAEQTAVSEPYSDIPNQTSASVSRTSSDGSIEMIGEEEATFPMADDAKPKASSDGSEDDWLNVEMTTIMKTSISDLAF